MKNELRFLIDEPTLDDHLGVHQNLAQVLLDVIKSESNNPLVVGLFGGWGTGKSSVIRMFLSKLKNTPQPEIKNIEIDAWSFSEAKERFAPTLLQLLAQELLTKKAAERAKKAIDKKTEEWETQPRINWKTWLFVLGVLVLLSIAATSLVSLVGFESQAELGFMFFILGTLLTNAIFNILLPRIFTSFERRTYDTSYNEVFHFRSEFKNLITKANVSTKHIVIIVDNLDRVQPEDAIEIIRLLKTFVVDFPRNKLGNKKIVIVLPVDNVELCRHLRTIQQISEPNIFLQKFFNITIHVPELVHENMYKFVNSEINSVIDSLELYDKDEQSDVVFLIANAARKSPRQAKFLINQFIAHWLAISNMIKQGKVPSVSAKGVAYFTALHSFGEGHTVPGLSDNGLSANLNGSEPEIRHFLEVTEHLRKVVPKREWLYIQRLQASEYETLYPDIWEINDLILRNDFEAVETKASDVSNINLIMALNHQVIEENRNNRIALAYWVLHLVEQKKIEFKEIPREILGSINVAIDDNWVGNEKLVRAGLAELISRGSFSQTWLKRTFHRVSTVQPQKELLERGGDLEGFLLHLLENPFATINDVKFELDKLIQNNVGNSPKLSSATLRSLSVVQTTQTMQSVIDNARNFWNQLDLSDRDPKKTIATAYSPSFAPFIVKLASSIQSNKLDVSLAHLMYNALQKIQGASEGTNIDDSTLIDSLVWVSRQSTKNPLELIYCLGIILIIWEIRPKLRISHNSLSKQTLITVIWSKMITESKNKELANTNLFNHLIEARNLLDSLNEQQAATLLSQPGIDIPTEILEKSQQNIMRFLQTALSQNNASIATENWFSDIRSLDVRLQLFFKALEGIDLSPRKFEEVLQPLKSLKLSKGSCAVLQQYAQWLISKINWSNQSFIPSANSVIEKVIFIDEICPLQLALWETLNGQLQEDFAEKPRLLSLNEEVQQRFSAILDTKKK